MSNKASSSNYPQGSPPLSPWLRKFGGDSRSVLNNPRESLAHSGLAPRFPDLHPTYYAEPPEAFSHLHPFPQPSDYELDMLFATEEAQLGLNAGLTTWEIGVLNERLVNDWPGGHWQSDPVVMRNILEQGEGAQVREDTWHPVFAKTKWYDFRVPIVDGKIFRSPLLPGITAQDVWSVDVPAVWTELRACIGLANRWFRLMATGPWLNNVCFERWEEWMEAEPTQGDRYGHPDPLGPNGKPMRVPAKRNECDAERVVKYVADKVAPVLIWTFVDDGFHPYDSADKADFYGRTVREWNDGIEPKENTPPAERKEPFITTYLHVKPLRVLLDPSSTLAERCQARWSLAMTMLHELMHAVNLAKHVDLLDIPPEPYYGEEWGREIGCSGIKNFFGTDFFEAPDIDTTGKTGYKYGMTMTEFPSLRSFEPLPSVNGEPPLYVGKVSTASPIPAAWLSSTLVESFYTTNVQRYGLAALQPPRLFTSDIVYYGFYSEHHRAHPLPSTPLNPIHDTITPQLQSTLTDLKARRALWSRLRPWYPSAHARWLRTPYSNTAARAILTRFKAATHPARRLGGETASRLAENEAHTAASGMYYWLHLSSPHPLVKYPNRDWIFSVLALMMQAVLPARTEGVGLEYPFRVVENTWFPSQAASQAGNGKWRFAKERWVYPQLRRVFELGVRHDQGHVDRDPDTGEDNYISNRQWLLERAVAIKQQWEGVEPLPRPLADALERELQSLFPQALYEKEPEDWLDWGFEFPEYSGELVTRSEVGEYVPWSEINQGGSGGGGGQAQAQAHMAQILRRGKVGSRTRAERPRTRYFTVSEVGDRVSDDLTGTNWALLPNDRGGYDVFDVSSILRNDPSLDLETAFESTERGRQIVSQQVVKVLQTEGHEPVGKLLAWKRREEVFEHDGEDGRDLWCIIGNLVYDITDFNFRSEAEKNALIALATGKRALSNALDGHDVPNLLGRLAPYKCGYLKQPAGLPPADRPFTLQELGRHIYPEVGMYCAVSGVVLDLGRYLAFHPGGAELLRQYAGRDATEAFQQTHADWQSTLHKHMDLRVGWIVSDMTDASDINGNEVVLLNRAFDISSLPHDGEDELYQGLQRYAGTDATEALKGEAAPEALRQLLTRDDLVSAKRTPALKRITATELRNHHHIPSKAERRARPSSGDKSWRVWVSVADEGLGKQMVYDVTTMVMFGGSEVEQRLRPWLGKEVRDVELADLLRSRHESFSIGELVGEGTSVPGQRVAASKHGRHEQSLAGSKRRADAEPEDDSDSDVVDRSKRRRVWRPGRA